MQILVITRENAAKKILLNRLARVINILTVIIIP